VVAADAAGDRRADPGAGREGGAPIDESARIRARQASAVIDAALSGVLAAPLRIDSTRIATVGLSLGGYAALAAHSLDARPSAAFALCPMAGPSPFVPQTAGLASLLRVDAGGRPVAVRARRSVRRPCAICRHAWRRRRSSSCWRGRGTWTGPTRRTPRSPAGCAWRTSTRTSMAWRSHRRGWAAISRASRPSAEPGSSSRGEPSPALVTRGSSRHDAREARLVVADAGDTR
jgi:hypothetical protein